MPEIKKEIGSKLSDFILFDSYARGDYDEESKIDELKTANNRVYYCVFHVMISPEYIIVTDYLNPD